MFEKAGIAVICVLMVTCLIVIMYLLWYLMTLLIWAALGVYFTLGFVRKNRLLKKEKAVRRGFKKYLSRVSPKQIREIIMDALLELF